MTREIKNSIRFSLIFLFASLAGCAAQGPDVSMSAADVDRLMAVNDNLIVPGKRIGPIFLGMTEAQLYKRLGDPKQIRNNGPYTLYYYGDLDASIQKSTGKAIQVTAETPQYSTPEGIKVGSSLLETKSKLTLEVPDNVDAANADYHLPNGLNLGVTNGRVRAIWVN